MLIEKEIFIYGLIISISSSVLTLQGFLMAFVGEVFRVCLVGLETTASGTFGLVVNLYRNETMDLLIGALLLNPSDRISQGSKVNGMCALLRLILGDFAISSILHPLASYVLNAARIDAHYAWLVESPAPPIIDRQSVFEPLQTGLLSIDSMIPVGRGQRELIVGDRALGKTSIGLDTILNQKYEKVFCVFSPIGQKASHILDAFLALVQCDAVFYLSVLYASASASALAQYLCAYTAAALSEFFMIVRQLPVFLMLDDLSKHAYASREIYLLLRRPPGREAYPGEIFFVHSRLLERSAKLSSSRGSGSCSAFPVIETLSSDVSAYISTNVISITDGQLFLSQHLFLSSVIPAIDVTFSVTRVGSAAQSDGMKLLAGSYKLELTQYIELQSFAQFQADCGKETLARLARGLRLLEMLKQSSGSPMNLRQQIGILSLANQGTFICPPPNTQTKHFYTDASYVQLFLRLYLDVPLWVTLFIPPRLLGSSIIAYCQM
jgi:F-type H+-transporting ATPase subunit alpha